MVDNFKLTRAFFDWTFENPDLIQPGHCAIFFFAIEHHNRLGWPKKFGFPSRMAMDAIGIKKHHTYLKYFNELIEWGFFTLIKKSNNQYSSNVISLASAMPKNGGALGRATAKHAAEHGHSMGRSKDNINIPITNNKEPITQSENVYRKFLHLSLSNLEFDELLKIGYNQSQIDSVLDSVENYKSNTKYKSLFLTSKKWLKKEFPEVINEFNWGQNG